MTTNNRQQPCLKCGNKFRTIKVGLTQNRIKKQRWFCYACRRQFQTEINPNSHQTMNSSGITVEDEITRK